MLEVEFNRKGLKSAGLGVLLESLGVQSVAFLLFSRICMKRKCFSVLACVPPCPILGSETKKGLAKILLNRVSLKIPLSTLRDFPWCEERDFLRQRNELK